MQTCARIVRLLSATACFCLAAPSAFAGEHSIDTLAGLSQSQFSELGRDLGAALHYKAIAPAAPLGILGVDVGVEVSDTRLGNSHLWALVNTQGSSSENLIMTRLHAHKGLPFGWDVGASYSQAPDSNISMLGAEVSYAIWEGNLLWPALAVRGSYAQMEGVSVLGLNSKALELTISKGFLLLTPYAGVGYVWTNIDPSQTGISLTSATLEQTKVYLGSHFNFLGVNTGLEVENTDGRNTLSLKPASAFNSAVYPSNNLMQRNLFYKSDVMYP